MNYYARHIGDYLKATTHLSLLEHGIYSRLLDVYYTREAPIPKDQAARLIGARSKIELEALNAVLAEFFDDTPEGWRQSRCDMELVKFKDKSAKARESALASVESRRLTWQERGKIARSERLASAKVKGTHSKEDWEFLKGVSNHQCAKCGGGEPLEKDHITPLYQGGSDGLDNLQPLCVPCNRSKGPDNTDHRSESVRLAVAERSLNDRLAPNNQEPITNNQVSTKAPPAARTPASKKSQMPPDFGISDRVKAWAIENKHGQLEQHLVAFRLACQAKGYAYADWDAAFMKAVRDNWAKLAPTPQQLAAAPRKPDKYDRADLEYEKRYGTPESIKALTAKLTGVAA